MFELTGDAPEAVGIFAYAEALFGWDARTWVLTAGEDALHENRYAQFLCTLQALIATAVLAPSLPAKRCVAGYSVGEVAAWSVAGLIKPEDALDLIVARAGAMDSACRGEQGMLFLRGLSRSVLEDMTERAEAAVAIVNPGEAYVIGGMQSALVAIAAEARQGGAARVVPIAVKIASHTRLMADATPVFRDRLSQIQIERALPAGTRLLSGIDGEAVLNISEGVDKLAQQISHPIQWTTCLHACVEAGATVFLELGPGRALADMAASAFPGITARSVDEFKSIQGVRAWLDRML
jgi:[acyl-carrier-protein] S-malonyltransferase